MGFESFRVELVGGRAKCPDVDNAVRMLPHVQPDPHSIPMQGSTYFVMDDGQHVIEVELIDSPVRLSCRFTLCHPSSVDAVFLSFVKELMVRLGMEARICDDVLPEHSRSYFLDEFEAFSAITSSYVAARRTEWIAAFGDKAMAASTNDVYQRIILPRCQPGIKQPT
jgi:hypothetical protein